MEEKKLQESGFQILQQLVAERAPKTEAQSAGLVLVGWGTMGYSWALNLLLERPYEAACH